MNERHAPGRPFRGILFSGFAALLLAAGCRSDGDAAAGITPEPAAPKPTQTELLAFCPPVGLREGTAFFTSYGGGGAAPRGLAEALEDPAADAAPPGRPIRYQTSITDVTRTCSRSGGQLTMTIAVAGKIVPGPAGGPGNLTLPIRIAVTNGPDVLFTKLYQYPTQVAGGAATTFLFTAPDVGFTDLGVRSVRAFAGFDEGPPAQGD